MPLARGLLFECLPEEVGGLNRQFLRSLLQATPAPELGEAHNFFARLSQFQPAWCQLMTPDEYFQAHSTASARREVLRCRPLVHLAIPDDFPSRRQALDNNGLVCPRKIGHHATERSNHLRPVDRKIRIHRRPYPLSDLRNQRGPNSSLELAGGFHPILRSDQKVPGAAPNPVSASKLPVGPPPPIERPAIARCRRGHLFRARRAFLSGGP